MSQTGFAQLLSSLGAHGESVPVTNPNTGKLSFELPQHSADDIALAVAQAREAQASWASANPRLRGEVVLRLHDQMIKHRERLLELIQFETGKTRAGAFEDFAGALFAARYYGKQAPKLLRRHRTPTDAPGFVRNYVEYAPVGVVGVITPWNFPLALPAFDVLPALLAGNAVIHKADNQTALTALYLRQLALDAGLPDNLWTVVACSGADANLITDSVDYIAFTGSTATGRIVAQRAASRLIGYSLELGGKNPAIVLRGANLARTARSLVPAVIGNAGQICVAIERCYVPAEKREEFVRLLEREFAKVSYGRSNAFDTDMGSLTGPKQLARVESMLDEARVRGLEVIGGQHLPEHGPYFVAPAIVVEPTDEVALNRTEVFGPVLQVYGYSALDEAVAAANDSEFGLNASVYGPVGQALKVASRIEAGSVNINEGYRASFGSMASPMGGVKHSGHGRRNGINGLLRFTEPKAIGVAAGWPRLPQRARDYRGISNLLIVLSKVLRRF